MPHSSSRRSAIGSVLAPIASLLLLRSVPLWRAILETSIGTILGVTAGLLVQPIRPVLGGVIGFYLAAARLHSSS